MTLTRADWLLDDRSIRRPPYGRPVLLKGDWDESKHPRVPAGSPEGGEWTSGEGGGEGASEPRTFTSEDGYRWHEENPAVQQWVRALSPESSAVLLDYAGFGYLSINDTLRGRGPTKDAMLRRMTPEEIAAVQAARAADRPDPEPPEGRLARYAFDWEHGGPAFWQVRASVPDEERRARARTEADQIEAVLRKDGFDLPEALQVGRGAYLPGVSEDDLRAKIGQVYEEPGFTSTMLGNAGGRLDGYAAWAKWESINQRFGNEPVRGEPASALVRHQDEVGTAIRFTIDVPAGTRVAPIEAVRQEKQRRDDEKYGSKSERRRFESEILLGRGSRFRILGVTSGPTYKGSDPTLKPVKLTDVHLRYLGHGQ